MNAATQLFADILRTAELAGPSRAASLTIQAVSLPELVFEGYGWAWRGAVGLAQSRSGVSISALAAVKGAPMGARGNLAQLAGSGNVIHDAREAVKAITGQLLIGDLASLERLIRETADMVAHGSDQADAVATVRKAASAIREMGAHYGATVGDIMDAGLRSAEYVAEHGFVADIQTGVPARDVALGGGLRKQGLHVFGFRTSDGKTILGAQSAILNARRGKRVLFLSLEMDPATLGERILVHESGKPWGTLCGRDKGQSIEAYQAAREAWREMQDRLIVVSNRRMDMAAIRMALLETQTRFGPVDLVVVDHIQIVTGSDPKAQRYREVGNVAEELFRIAKEENLAVMLMSQLNPVPPEIMGQKKAILAKGGDPFEPSWADLRESRDIGMHAFTVVLGWTSWQDGKPSGSYFKVEKSRQGQRGVTVPATMKPALFQFTDFEPREDSPDNMAQRFL